MNGTRVEKIAFRFTRQETAALLKALGVPELPGTALSAGLPENVTLNRMIAEGIILPAGEKLLVDRTIALIIMSAAKSERYLKAESPAGTAVLYAGKYLCVLAELTDQGLLILAPLEDLQAARRPFLKAAGGVDENLNLTLRDKDVQAYRTGGTAALEELLAKLEEKQ